MSIRILQDFINFYLGESFWQKNFLKLWWKKKKEKSFWSEVSLVVMKTTSGVWQFDLKWIKLIDGLGYKIREIEFHHEKTFWEVVLPRKTLRKHFPEISTSDQSSNSKFEGSLRIC